MSRALEPGITPSSRDDIQSIYQDVTKALTFSELGELLEIEFLGKSHPLPPGCNILSDGNSIGISKAKLVQAFIMARKVLLKYMRSSLKQWEADLRNATAVILLMDPEHLTAANTRKRLIQMNDNQMKSELERVLKIELRFVDSYLTSRLHRHTKSPTLWGHRRWVLEQFHAMKLKHDIHTDVKSVILVAAERHPKNYYAWSHLRWLVQTFGLHTEHVERPFSVVLVQEDEILFTAVKDWCLKHPSDTSGFSFLLFYLTRVPRLLNVERGTSICQEVLRRAVSFKWCHESVWVFLRTLVASEAVGEEERQEFFHAIDSVLEVHPEAKRVLIASRDWCSKYESRLRT